MLQLSQTIFYGQVNFRIIQLYLKFHLGFSNLKLHGLSLQSYIVTKPKMSLLVSMDSVLSNSLDLRVILGHIPGHIISK